MLRTLERKHKFCSGPSTEKGNLLSCLSKKYLCFLFALQETPVLYGLRTPEEKRKFRCGPSTMYWKRDHSCYARSVKNIIARSLPLAKTTCFRQKISEKIWVDIRTHCEFFLQSFITFWGTRQHKTKADAATGWEGSQIEPHFALGGFVSKLQAFKVSGNKTCFQAEARNASPAVCFCWHCDRNFSTKTNNKHRLFWTSARCPWTQRRRFCLQRTGFSDSSSSIWVSASDGIGMSTRGIESHFNKRWTLITQQSSDQSE